MVERDIFVGAVAFCLGLFFVFGAIANSSWCYRLRFVRWIDRSKGRNVARTIVFAGGACLCFLGVVIAQGITVVKPNVLTGPNDIKPANKNSEKNLAPHVRGRNVVASPGN